MTNVPKIMRKSMVFILTIALIVCFLPSLGILKTSKAFAQTSISRDTTAHYEVTVSTADEEGAGTDDISFYILGKGDEHRQALGKPIRNTSQGTDTILEFDGQDIGDIYMIRFYVHSEDNPWCHKRTTVK